MPSHSTVRECQIRPDYHLRASHGREPSTASIQFRGRGRAGDGRWITSAR